MCDHISSERMSAFILPEDKCLECDDIAGISSHASNPIFSLDHGSFQSGSIAFKMHPSPEDMNAFFIDILHYFNWLNFVLVYDDDKGETACRVILIHFGRRAKKCPIYFSTKNVVVCKRRVHDFTNYFSLI